MAFEVPQVQQLCVDRTRILAGSRGRSGRGWRREGVGVCQSAPLKGVFAFFERECCRCIFHGLAVGACLGEVFLLVVACEDCLAVTSEVLWPEVTKVCD